jgi:hypothetical protein
MVGEIMVATGHRNEETERGMPLVEEMTESTGTETGNDQTEGTTVTEIEDMTANGRGMVGETKFRLPTAPPTP